MAQAELRAWFSSAAQAAILLFLASRFLDGLHFVEPSTRGLIWTYVTAIVMAIVAESAIAGVLAAQRRGAPPERDERDIAIEGRCNQIGFWFVMAALNVVVIHLLANAAYPQSPPAQPITLSMTALAFFLIVLLFAAEITKRVAMIVLYRWQR